MSKAVIEPNTANEYVVEHVPAKIEGSEPLHDDKPAKSCCCACCAPCWSSFTNWLSQVWEAIKPCCTTTGKIAGNVAIKIGEDALKTKIIEAENLTDKQKEILISALTKTANDLTKGINDPQLEVIISIFATAVELLVNGATDKAVTEIARSSLSDKQKELLIGALEKAGKIAVDVIDSHVHPQEASAAHVKLAVDDYKESSASVKVDIDKHDGFVKLSGDAVVIHDEGHA
jgi:hypothetical protein